MKVKAKSSKQKAAAADKRKKKGFFYEITHHWELYLMTLPAIIFFLIFNYGPLPGLYYAFTNYTYQGGLFGSPFVGLQNFKYLFYGGLDSPIWTLTRNTILYNLAFILLGNLLQCLIAILLSEMVGKKFVKVAQSLILLPYFVSYVIVGTIAYNVFSTKVGLLNSFLGAIGASTVDVYTMPKAWPGIIIFFNIWKGLGYGTVIYLASITGLDKEVYDAAKIDGCNVFQEIRYITMPLLKPTFIMLVLFNLGGIMRGQFELFYQLVGSNGLLYRYTDVIDTYIFRTLSVNFNVGYSTAAGLYQSVFGLVIVVFVNWIVKKTNPENALF